MSKRILLLLALAWTFASKAQDSASVFWEMSVNTINTCITSGGLTASAQNVSSAYVVRDYGGMETSQRVYSSGGGMGFWPSETAINGERWCEFTCYPRKGLTFQLTGLQLRLGNSGGSTELKASVYYSLNNFTDSVCLVSAEALPSKDLKWLEFQLSDSLLMVENEQALSIRVYPWLNGGAGSGKYFNIRDVRFTGITTGEIVAELPEVSSLRVDKISTQTAKFYGKAISDGGVSLDSLGLVISAEPNPDTTNVLYLVSPEVGSFQVSLSELNPGMRYFIRAFAINAAGVAYGETIEFTTLEHLSVPGVKTLSVTELKPIGAVALGSVYFDGGLDVSLTGFCLSSQVSPTLSDTVVEAGSGLGNFSAYLAGLKQECTYYLRAFAQNAQGTAFGEQLEFKTPAPAADINMVVDKSGNGDYTSLQDAFDKVPLNYTGNINILVKNGVYQEKALLSAGKINVHLMGEHRDSTIIRWDDYSGKVVGGVTLGTSTSYTVAIDADDFIAQNITFQNTYDGSQAVALRTKGDRMIFQNCRMLGFQDTYYTWGRGRIYHQDCYLEGTVDFIFGSAVAIFKNCTIKSLRNSPVTAANTELGYKFGYVFVDCHLISDNISGATLGRPWKEYAQTVYINTIEDKHISPAGWLEWSGTNNHLTCYYAEYNCSGNGFIPESRVSWSHQLNDEQAALYTMENIFGKQTASPAYYYDWMPKFEPVYTTVEHNHVEEAGILSIYPNPTKDKFNLQFEMASAGLANIALFTTDGKKVATLVNGDFPLGKHIVQSGLNSLPPGVYVCIARLGKEVIYSKLVVEGE